MSNTPCQGSAPENTAGRPLSGLQRAWIPRKVMFLVHTPKSPHLLVGQLEVEDACVLLDVLGGLRLGDDSKVLLDGPAQAHAGAALAGLLRDGSHHGIAKQDPRAVLQADSPLRRASSKSGVGLNGNGIPAAVLHYAATLTERVQLELVDHGPNLGAVPHERLEMLREEVGHADRPHQALTVELLQDLPGGEAKLPAAARPVDEKHVQASQALYALHGGGSCLLAAHVARADLGLNDQSIRAAELPQSLADGCLVAVGAGGVDEAIAGPRGSCERCAQIASMQPPRSKSQQRELQTIWQSYCAVVVHWLINIHRGCRASLLHLSAAEAPPRARE
eukprot:CAMPEP_0175389658 /NCGR_PEP_ID=MMETSP0095-20121207/31005_1 /TAXON_ID=311494 /ORGANISM="Alexandrium monilatum, Strain CCMP3105" /LENGTH=333 /DNA_ID=CAMNT_0016688181 /DNA_START=42 /DNA_END=1040 /DNA_ORIENTATION=+